MADFSVRADHIDVEQIMRQIRARIRDKRGADYTEDEIRELAAVKLEKFLDPRAVRSDLLQHYRKQHQPTPLILPEEAHPPLWNFTPDTVYVSDRGVAGKILGIIRKILKPISKLFFHVDTVWDVLSKQSVINAQHTRLFQRAHQRFITRDELDSLNFEMFNNLVVELTRLGIEVKNLRMQVESFGTRLDFDERRARALEGVVQYRPGATVAKAPAPSPAGGDEDEEDAIGAGPGEAGDQLSRSARRRRRRRGRRRGPGEGGPADGPESREAGDTEAEDDRENGAQPPSPDATRGARSRDAQGWGTRRDESSEGSATAGPGSSAARDSQGWTGARRDDSAEGSAAAGSAERSPDTQAWDTRRDDPSEGSAASSQGWPVTRGDESAERSEVADIEQPAQESSEREPAAEPFFPESAAAAEVPEEPQRVFHRVFDRPRDPEPGPEGSTPAADAPRSDDHEPSQS
jgi:hypothetical protein